MKKMLIAAAVLLPVTANAKDNKLPCHLVQVAASTYGVELLQTLAKENGISHRQIKEAKKCLGKSPPN